ncbi:MAG TPA: DUF932 domain-containing protein [bacterium]|nr:DUF932 domain-containing protein [bacterium]
MHNTLEKLVEELRFYDARKKDVSAISNAIMFERGEFIFKGRQISVADTALRQLLGYCGIPPKFFKETLSDSEKTLLFNRLYRKKDGNAMRMYRFDCDELYGVVSDRYRKIDNIELIPVLEGMAGKGIAMEAVNITLNPDHTKIRLVPLDYYHGETAPMIEFTNSENGLGSMKVWAGVYRAVCSNGLMVEIESHTRTKWRHLCNTIFDLPDFNAVLSVSIDYMKRLDNSKVVYLGAKDKEKHLRSVFSEFGKDAADKVVEVARSEYRNGETLHDVVNSITRAAQHYQSRQRTEMERFATTILDSRN